MTIIEFFDKNAIENIAGALLGDPEKIILVGDRERRMKRSAEVYREILESKGKSIEFEYRLVSRNRLQDIVDVLSEIAEKHDDCIFDLTGGEDLYLTAVGIVMERYSGKIRCHRFNFRNNTVIDCDADGNTASAESFDVSVDDVVKMSGGSIVTDESRPFHTVSWDFSPRSLPDTENLWTICRKNPRTWNAQISVFSKIVELFEMPDRLTVSFDQAAAELALKQHKVKYFIETSILYNLQKTGLIHSLSLGNQVSFVCRSEQVFRCLTVAGQVLELIVAAKMMSLTDKSGKPLYHDVQVGVVMDWDEADENDEFRTINEVDVVAMKGAIPVFISCKNGDFDANELYKLDSVAARFGGEYVKKVLIATELNNLGEKGKYLRARMEDMSIRCVDDADSMADAELRRVLRSLWSN